MNQPKVKSEQNFTLKAEEARYLQSLQASFQQIMTGYLITISDGRLGYAVTPDTQFEFNVDTKSLIIREMERPEQPTQPQAPNPAPQAPPQAPEQPQNPGSTVKPAQ